MSAAQDTKPHANSIMIRSFGGEVSEETRLCLWEEDRQGNP